MRREPSRRERRYSLDANPSRTADLRLPDAGLARQWGGDPLAEDPEKLAALASFCEFLDQDPDELLAFCFLRRRSTGERFASKQRREELNGKLKQFVTASGLRGVEARRRRNHVVSFLSHNGVLI